MAAQKLAKAGKKVIVLEARDRCGGRIHTIDKESFFKQAELGAEFIHGDLPATLNLLKEAGITYYPATAEMWRYQNGLLTRESFFADDWHLLLGRLNALNKDISIEAFIEKQFRGKKYDTLKNTVRKFVSGYDTADPHKVSAFALRKEWQGGDSDMQYRISGGYGVVIKYLEKEFDMLALEGLCTLVPPSYIENFAEKYPKTFNALKYKEDKWKAKWPWRSIGDYYIISFKKKSNQNTGDDN